MSAVASLSAAPTELEMVGLPLHTTHAVGYPLTPLRGWAQYTICPHSSLVPQRLAHAQPGCAQRRADAGDEGQEQGEAGAEEQVLQGEDEGEREEDGAQQGDEEQGEGVAEQRAEQEAAPAERQRLGHKRLD